MDDCRVMYEYFYHRDGNFDAYYGDMSVEEKLEIMGFVRVTPMPIKSGEMVFPCNCGVAYQNYACEHSGVVSMLWNPDMKLSDIELAQQPKAKKTKKASNPFDAVAKRNKKEKIDQPSAKDMAANSRSLGHARRQARMHFL